MGTRFVQTIDFLVHAHFLGLTSGGRGQNSELRQWPLETGCSAESLHGWLLTLPLLLGGGCPIPCCPSAAGLPAIFNGQWVQGATSAGRVCLPQYPWHLQLKYHLLWSLGLGSQGCMMARGRQTARGRRSGLRGQRPAAAVLAALGNVIHPQRGRRGWGS